MNHLTRACYVDCSKENYCDDTFALIILREGCFISYLLDTVVDQKWDELSKLFDNRGRLLGFYQKWDELSKLFDKRGRLLGFYSVVRDMVLLENQIPLAVLELLGSLRYNNKKVVPKMIKQFIYFLCLGLVPLACYRD